MIFTVHIDFLISICACVISLFPGLCKLIIRHLNFGNSHQLGLLGFQTISFPPLKPRFHECWGFAMWMLGTSHYNCPIFFGLQPNGSYYTFGEMKPFTVTLLLPSAATTSCLFLSPAPMGSGRGFAFHMLLQVITSFNTLSSRNLALLVYKSLSRFLIIALEDISVPSSWFTVKHNIPCHSGIHVFKLSTGVWTFMYPKTSMWFLVC